jgi:hypothetical protein
MPLTNYSRQKIILGTVGKSFFGDKENEGYYLALSSTEPDVYGGNVAEPSAGAGYSRVRLDKSLFSEQAIFPSTPTYNPTTDTYSLTNNADIVFPEATTGWGTLAYFAIFTSKTGGSMIAFGSLTTSISPQANTVPIVRARQMTISEEAQQA